MNTSRKILLVEDNADHVYLFMRALRTSGLDIEVDHVPDGREAVNYLSSRIHETAENSAQLPKLLLLDIKLPIMTGFDVLHWLSLNPAVSRKTSAILLTTSEDPEDKEKARRLRARDYWIKPPNMQGYAQLMSNLKEQLAVPSGAEDSTGW
ncbi:MAG TPA: response regulator [Candidatus Saccharimonadales bacterium]|nr:response regulator [Candidatus Saccharimonadales bacterium]